MVFVVVFSPNFFVHSFVFNKFVRTSPHSAPFLLILNLLSGVHCFQRISASGPVQGGGSSFWRAQSTHAVCVILQQKRSLAGTRPLRAHRLHFIQTCTCVLSPQCHPRQTVGVVLCVYGCMSMCVCSCFYGSSDLRPHRVSCVAIPILPHLQGPEFLSLGQGRTWPAWWK